MAHIGYHISHEQFPPSELLELAVKAEKAGFEFCLSSDHFHPWNEDQGQSGFAWSWLGAAMARTKMKFGIVNCPAYRYHPAVIAQAAATLEEMFPDRFWLAIGSGQAINESITGEPWPEKQERNQRLQECEQIIRKLWSGETVTHKGLVNVARAKLYTLPRTQIKLVAAALTPETAAWAAGWADGLITASQEIEGLSQIVKAWRKNGGADKPMILKVQLSYHEDKDKAKEGAHREWRTNIFGSDMLSELRTTKQLEQAAELVQPDAMESKIIISDDTKTIVKRLKEFIALGFRELVLHNVNREQESFIEVFGKEVLGELKTE